MLNENSDSHDQSAENKSQEGQGCEDRPGNNAVFHENGIHTVAQETLPCEKCQHTCQTQKEGAERGRFEMDFKRFMVLSPG